MRLFRSRPSEASVGAPDAVQVRRPVRECYACGQARALYVFADDGRDYCVPCARDLWVTKGLRPAGRRREDLRFEELLQYELGGPREDRPSNAP